MPRLATIIVLIFLSLSQHAFASAVKVRVTPESQEKSKLNIDLSIQEKSDIYQITLETTKEGVLEKLFRVDVVIYEGDKRLLVAPLEQHTASKENHKVRVTFILDKSLLKGAVLNLRTGNYLAEVDFEIQLAAYPKQTTVKK
jgi:hypothetical protein